MTAPRSWSTLNILFIHPNFPGQFRHLAACLAGSGRHRIVFATKRADRAMPGVEKLVYPAPRQSGPQTHPYLRQFEDAVLNGQALARALLQSRSHFEPDLVIGHPGWGETLFIKDVFPHVPLISYGEFFYRSVGADVNCGLDAPLDIDTTCELRARTGHLLLALEAADRTLCPTEWQRSLHPAGFHDRISVIHDGIDTEIVKPDRNAQIRLPTGAVLTRADEVVTYAARHLEPYRGFSTFMRALPRICAARPKASIVICGGDGPGYGKPPPGGGSWREALLREVSIDPRRVHFLGQIDYGAYLALLQVSSAHVYLTVPFVLSWSALEAMATGCLVIGSDTAPVREVIADGRNGRLVDFFSPDTVADSVIDTLRYPRAMKPMRIEARATVLRHYSTAVCLPRHLAMIGEVTGSDRLAKAAA